MLGEVLVADIGGTNARFAIARRASDGGAWGLSHRQTLRADDHPTIEDALDTYLASVQERPRCASFAAAGPITPRGVSFTNSAWVVERDAFAQRFSFERFGLINDFRAMAAGAVVMPAEAFVTIKKGAGEDGAPILVIGPGTGLGQAFVLPDSQGYHAVATEGGHISFAPQTDEEIEILRYMRQHHDRVSVERLVSGIGLGNLYQALGAINGVEHRALTPSEISSAALGGHDPIAVRTLELFCVLLGRATGDAVISIGAKGGVILAGGVLPKMLDFFQQSGFLDGYLAKGRMRDYVDVASIKLLIAQDAALIGSATIAERNI